MPFHANRTSSDFGTSQVPIVGWKAPYELFTLVIALLLFAAFGIWEYKLAAHPIVPLSIWTAPSFTPLIIVVTFSFISYGTFSWYMVAWQQEIRHWSMLSLAAGLMPLPMCAGFAAVLAAWLIPRMPAQWILALGASTILGAQVLIATMPEQQTYWAQVFPATIIQSFCPDLIFTAAQIVACNSVGHGMNKELRVRWLAHFSSMQRALDLGLRESWRRIPITTVLRQSLDIDLLCILVWRWLYGSCNQCCLRQDAKRSS